MMSLACKVARVSAVVVALVVGLLAAPTWATGTPPIRSRPVYQETPEIDPGLARSMGAILVGGVLILTERRRHRR